MATLKQTQSACSLAVAHSHTYDTDGTEWVVICGYSSDGKVGYFICTERYDGYKYHYEKPTEFVVRHNEFSFAVVLAKFKQYISDLQNAKGLTSSP